MLEPRRGAPGDEDSLATGTVRGRGRQGANSGASSHGGSLETQGRKWARKERAGPDAAERLRRVDPVCPVELVRQVTSGLEGCTYG